MEIFGGFMVMMSIIGLFLAVVWLVMPFVVFAVKGKQDRALEVLEAIEKRLAAIETHLQAGMPSVGYTDVIVSSSQTNVENTVSPSEQTVENNC